MSDTQQKFMEKFGSHWIKIKFYTDEPDEKNFKEIKNVRFCEATKIAINHPVILDSDSINCPGALFAFGWQDKSQFYQKCLQKSKLNRKALDAMITKLPRLNGEYKYIGLNTTDEPDVILSYILPEDAMKLLYLYHNKQAENLDASLCSMTSICGGIAVKTFIKNEIGFSFGCAESREFARIGSERLVVGIPGKHFDLVSYV
ncbi:DUF169 domain-containing protein [candidate division KSB1 bacterium]|nr:DUF169 domain-containing protein [candidate division KSB1 bacterium]